MMYTRRVAGDIRVVMDGRRGLESLNLAVLRKMSVRTKRLVKKGWMFPLSSVAKKTPANNPSPSNLGMRSLNQTCVVRRADAYRW